MRSLTLDLLRHGKTRKKGIYQGRSDIKLSSMGEQQMALALAQASGWQKIISSPLKRCSVPAEKAALQLKMPYEQTDWLIEYDFGQWDGRSLEAVYKEQPERVSAFWNDPAQTSPPEGESVTELQQRVKQGLLSLEASQYSHLLLVTHGGVIRALIAECLGLPPARWVRMRLDHACFTRIQFFYDQGHVWSELVTCNTERLPAGSS